MTTSHPYNCGWLVLLLAMSADKTRCDSVIKWERYMSPEQIVDFIRTQTEDCLQKYADFFNSDLQGDDSSGNLAKSIFLSMDKKGQETFIDFLRDVQTDTLGAVFDLLDNQAYPMLQTEDLILTHGAKKLNGDLTAILFEKEELSIERE